MSSRWEKQAFDQVVAKLDPHALAGRSIQRAGIDIRVLDSCPETHSEPTASECRVVYESLRQSAEADGRLSADAPLVKNWKLIADIYSPKLRRFIEIDETQHFSMVRLTRLQANRALLGHLFTLLDFGTKYIPFCLEDRERTSTRHTAMKLGPTGMKCAKDFRSYTVCVE